MYCPLVWICHSRELNNKTKSLHEWILRLVYKDRGSTFEELLIREKSVILHQESLQTLITVMYQVQHGISLNIMNDITYSTKNSSGFETRNIKTVHYG